MCLLGTGMLYCALCVDLSAGCTAYTRSHFTQSLDFLHVSDRILVHDLRISRDHSHAG